MRLLTVLVLLLATICSVSCSCKTPAKLPTYLNLMETPYKRLSTSKTSFQHERNQIDPRKRKAVMEIFGQYSAEHVHMDARKRNAMKVIFGRYSSVQIGLALSGGGIRSAAFQLGVMSSLDEKKVLKAIDYISAVSGGSWAAGAFKTYSGANEVFFKSLDSTVAKERSKLCDDSLRKYVDADYAMCREPGARILMSSYKETLKNLDKSVRIMDPLGKNVGFAFQEEWQAMIQENFLLGKDRPLHEIEKMFPDRPYLILNATHSEESASDSKHNFPFQFTSDTIGTIADCGNTEHYCEPVEKRMWKNGGHKGVFVDLQKLEKQQKLNEMAKLEKLNEKEKLIEMEKLNELEKLIKLKKLEKLKKLSTGLKPQMLFVSHALAISGAVAPVNYLGIDLNIMDWRLELPLPPMAKSVEEVPYRKQYVIADGGHSENFGVLPLMERNVDIIIISDGAFDPEARFKDFLVLKDHAKALLKEDIVIKQEGEGLKSLYWITGEHEPKKEHIREWVEQIARWVKQIAGMGTEKTNTSKEPKDSVYDPDSIFRFNGQFSGILHDEKEDQNLLVTINGERFSDICGEPDKCGSNENCLKLQKECREERDRRFAVHRWQYHSEGYREGGNTNHFIFEGYFSRPGRRNGKLIYLKPPKDLTDFYNYLLSNKEYHHIYNYLTLHKGTKFPCDKTFAESYHKELIKAYYLLGKFMGEEALISYIDPTVLYWPDLEPPRRYLNEGESVDMQVDAHKRWNDTGINVKAGEGYIFEPSWDDWWSDGCTDRPPEGFPSFALPVPDFMKRVPKAQWFEVVASIGETKSGFKVLQPAPVIMQQTGPLYLFANDAAGFYVNNSGKIKVTIKRIK